MTKLLFRHQHVEDYIEIIAGYRTPDGKQNSVFDLGEPIISLARYDMKIVPSLANQSDRGIGYTDKQAKLAAELVLKYERQLNKQQIDVEPVRDPHYRLPIRKIDRTKRTYLEDDKIVLRFPFETELVDQVREYCKVSKGHMSFDPDQKVYRADLTEHNVNWIYVFAKQNRFDIDPTVEDLMQLILSTEQQGYDMDLFVDQDQLMIRHAPESMLDYVTQRVGGFRDTNLLRLIDYSPILGYSVDPQIQHKIVSQHGHRFWKLATNRMLKIEPGTGADIVMDIIMYANLTDRLPVYVYEPDLSYKLLDKIYSTVPEDLIYSQDDDRSPPENCQIVYLTRLPTVDIARMPLLISSAGMLFGQNKSNFLQSAEKVVYFTQEVYNKHLKGNNVCKLD